MSQQRRKPQGGSTGNRPGGSSASGGSSSSGGGGGGSRGRNQQAKKTQQRRGGRGGGDGTSRGAGSQGRGSRNTDGGRGRGSSSSSNNNNNNSKGRGRGRGTSSRPQSSNQQPRSARGGARGNRNGGGGQNGSNDRNNSNTGNINTSADGGSSSNSNSRAQQRKGAHSASAQQRRRTPQPAQQQRKPQQHSSTSKSQQAPQRRATPAQQGTSRPTSSSPSSASQRGGARSTTARQQPGGTAPHSRAGSSKAPAPAPAPAPVQRVKVSMFSTRTSKAELKRRQQLRNEERKKRHAQELEDLRRRQQEEHEERERKAAEEAAKKAAEEEATRLAEEKARADALAIVTKRLDDEAKVQSRRSKLLVELASAAIAEARVASKSGKKAKADIKKTTALQKKIRNLSAADVDQIVESIQKLNLTRFKGDVANAFFEAPAGGGTMRSRDVLPMMRAIYSMHAKYEGFLEDLIEQYVGVFFPGGHQRFNFSRGLPIPPRARAAPNDGKHDTVLFTTVPDLKQHRIVLKVLVELFLCGFTGTNFALDVIAAAIARAQQLRRPLSPAGLELMHSIGGFFKSYGREYLGITSRSAQDFETENASVLEERPIEYAPCRVEKHSQAALHELLESYVEGLEKTLLSKAKDLRARRRHDQNTLLLRGELSEERQERYRTMKDKVEQLEANVAVFCDVLNREPVALTAILDKDEAEAAAAAEAEAASSVAVWSGKMEGEDSGPFPVDGPFPDRETQRFYCNLLDLREAGIPAVFLEENDAHSGDREKIRRERDAAQEATAAAEKAKEKAEETKGLSAAAKKQLEARKLDEAQRREEEDFDESEYLADLFGSSGGGHDSKGDSRSARLEKLLLDLPKCYRKDSIDDWAVEFCYLNSKANRKRLAQALYHVRWSSLELVPLYARLVATLNQVFPDLKVPLLEALRRQFHGLFRSKDQNRLGTKIKNARFIGELVKFQVAPPILAFNCLKTCFHDFRGHSIDTCCALIESCGRWLYKVPMEKVNQIAKKNLTTLMNLKRSKFLDQNTAYMIDSAYQAAVPSAGHTNIVVKEIPLLHKYLKHLLVGQKFDDGSLNSVVMRLRKLRWTPLPGGAAAAIEAAKLQVEKDAAERAKVAAETKSNEAGDWEQEAAGDSDTAKPAPDAADEKTPDDEESKFQVHARDAATHAAIGADGLLPVLTKYILNTCRGGRLDTIRVVCRLLQRLKRFRATIVMRVIDELLERIEHGVETNDYREQQRRVGEIFMLAELYNSALVRSQCIFDVLNLLIKYDHEVPKDRINPRFRAAGVVVHHPLVLSRLDRPDDPFRVKLVCLLIDTSARTLLRRRNARLVRSFLVLFSRYVHSKTVLSIETRFMLEDMLALVAKDPIKYEHPTELRTAQAAASAVELKLFEAQCKRWERLHGVTAAAAAAATASLEVIDDEDEDDASQSDDGSSSRGSDNEGDESDSDEAQSDEDDSDGESDGSDDDSDGSGEEGSEPDDGDSEESDASEEELEVRLRPSAPIEDPEFDALFQEMMSDNRRNTTTTNQSRAASAGTGKNMAIPTMLLRGPLANERQPNEDEGTASATPAANDSQPDTDQAKPVVKFKLLQRTGRGKVEARALYVPKSANLAQFSANLQAQKEAEQAALLQRTLAYQRASLAEQSSDDDYEEDGRLTKTLIARKSHGPKKRREKDGRGRGRGRGRGAGNSGRDGGRGGGAAGGSPASGAGAGASGDSNWRRRGQQQPQQPTNTISQMLRQL